MGNSLRKHALALLAAFLLTYFITLTLNMNDYYRATFADTVEGNAYRPFAYRALYPWLIRTTVALLPSGAKAGLTTYGQSTPWAERLIAQYKIPTDYIPQYLIFIGITVASFYGFFLILRALIAHFYPHISSLGTDLWMFFALPPMALLSTIYFYVYDPGLWFTFYLAFWLMVQRQWMPFLLAFFLCTFNKESSLLLIPILYCWTRNEGPKQRRLLMFATVVIWTVTFAILRITYGGNRGSFLEFHLFNQWFDHKTPEMLVSFLSTVPWFCLLCAHRWKEKPLILRQSVLWTFVTLFFLMLVFGYILEMRDYYESFAFAYLLAIPSLTVMVQWVLGHRNRALSPTIT